MYFINRMKILKEVNMIDLRVSAQGRAHNIQRAKEQKIIIPTISQMKDPRTIPDKILDQLKSVGLWDVNPLNLFRITWKNEPKESGGLFGAPNYIVLPSELTGVKAKILLMVGGWGKNADGFSMMARDPAKRKAFCDNVLKACMDYGIDGVDLDWEYPTYGAKSDGGAYVNGYHVDDTKNFTLLVKELRETLGKDRLISYAASDSGKYMDHKAALEYVDYLNIMTYSMGDPPSKHNSPLYKSFQNSRGGAESIDIYIGKGVPVDRMNYGMAYYGHGDGEIYPSSVQFHRIKNILEKGVWTDDKGKEHSVVGYNIRYWDKTGKVPYLGDASGKMYASYEDLESIAEKIKFVKQKGLLGAFGWEYREDEASGTLRHAVYEGLRGKQ